MTRIRDDKDWKTATSLARLKVLYKESKETTGNIYNNLFKTVSFTSTNTPKQNSIRKCFQKKKVPVALHLIQKGVRDRPTDCLWGEQNDKIRSTREKKNESK